MAKRIPRRKPARARKYHHGNLRRAMLDAALGLMEEEGAGALTLRAAARRAGVSQAAPYRHFASKQALLAAVAEEGFRTMGHAMRAASAAEVDGPLARFRVLGLAYVEFATAHPAHFRVMFGRAAADRSAYPSLQEAAGETFDLLMSAIADCQGAGLVRPGDPAELALTAWSATHGLASLWVDGQLTGRARGTLGDLARALAANTFLGLAPR